MKKLILVISLFMLPLVCFAQLSENFEEVITDSVDGVIITQSAAKYYYHPDYKKTNENGYFTPTKDEVLKAERKLVEYLDQYKPANTFDVSPLSKDLVKYKRYYVGVILEGEKKIWLKFVYYDETFKHYMEMSDWKHALPIEVDGGGNHYFRVLYDIKSDRIVNFNMNGPR